MAASSAVARVEPGGSGAPAHALRSLGDLAFALDALTILAISIAICLASQRLVVMTVFVSVALALRLALWLFLPTAERDGTRAGEILFYALCTLFGAFNDWSSVTRHRVYEYTVPTDLPGLSDIPIWMLLYWGMVLRFMLSVAHWRRLGLLPQPDVLRIGSLELRGAVAKVSFELALVVATRQFIYRSFAHPVRSWLPFAIAIALAALVLRLDRRRLLLMAAVIVVGPLVEVLYIRLGGLHRYQLGWFFGVPLWIALWWGLGVTIWHDLGTRLQAACDALVSRRGRA
jgi:hypothetical protein